MYFHEISQEPHVLITKRTAKLATTFDPSYQISFCNGCPLPDWPQVTILVERVRQYFGHHNIFQLNLHLYCTSGEFM